MLKFCIHVSGYTEKEAMTALKDKILPGVAAGVQFADLQDNYR